MVAAKPKQEQLTILKDGGQALLGIRRTTALRLHLFLILSPASFFCPLSLRGCLHSPGSSPAPDSGERQALSFPDRVKELSCQLYSTLIIQAMWLEILCILFS